MTADRIEDTTPEEWRSAIAAAEAYGWTLETQDPQLIAQARRDALDAGCVDSDQQAKPDWQCRGRSKDDTPPEERRTVEDTFRSAMTRAVIDKMNRHLAGEDHYESEDHIQEWLSSVGGDPQDTIEVTLTMPGIPDWIQGEQNVTPTPEGRLEARLTMKANPRTPTLLIRTSVTGQIAFQDPNGELESVPLDDAQQGTLNRYCQQVAFLLTGLLNGQLLEDQIAAQAEEYDDEDLQQELDKLLPKAARILEILRARVEVEGHLPPQVADVNAAALAHASEALEAASQSYADCYRPMSAPPG